VADILRDLLERCRNSDQEACRLLVQRYQGGALIVAEAIIGDLHLAQDAIQQAFLTVFSRLNQLRDPEAFVGWFRQIVRTESIKIACKKRSHQFHKIEPPSDTITPADIAVSQELRQIVHKALTELPSTGRRTVEMFYLDQQNCSDIAAKLNIPAGTVKRRLYDARQKLRRRLRQYVEEPQAGKPVLPKFDDTLPF
jgi:RNA polymerase sigma factor (sigma-70 family)